VGSSAFLLNPGSSVLLVGRRRTSTVEGVGSLGRHARTEPWSISPALDAAVNETPALSDADDGGIVKERVQRLSDGADVRGLEHP
jgi:hypothetical protein